MFSPSNSQKQTNFVRNRVGRLYENRSFNKDERQDKMKRRISGEEKEITVPLRTSFQLILILLLLRRLLQHLMKIKQLSKENILWQPWNHKKNLEKPLCANAWIKWQGGWKGKLEKNNKLRLLSMKNQKNRKEKYLIERILPYTKNKTHIWRRTIEIHALDSSAFMNSRKLVTRSKQRWCQAFLIWINHYTDSTLFT